MAKVFMILGLILLLAGIFLHVVGTVPWLGRLPGDIIIKKENFTFYFPITTCILISLMVSMLLRLWGR